MYGKYIVPLLFLGLTACPSSDGMTASPAPLDKDNEVYKAFGNEPDWMLEIGTEKIRYTGDYGETILVVDTPEIQQSLAVARYKTPELKITIMQRPCNDSMADITYADTVILNVKNRELQGCGGSILPPGSLDGTSWLAVTGVIGTSQTVKLRFKQNRISGNAGCNSMNGSYVHKDGRLMISRMMMSRKLCGGQADIYEQRLLDIFSQGPAVSFLANGNMKLSSGTDSLEFKKQT